MESVYILSVDTATEVCSVAVSKNGDTIACKELGGENTHSQILLPYINDIMGQAGIDIGKISAVAVSEGPGSYTGLRIGTSTVKGLCYAWQVPMIAVSTLAAIAGGAMQQYGADKLYCPMIDARRMEVYCAIYEAHLHEVQPINNVIVDEHSFEQVLASHTVVFCGNAVEKVRPMYENNKQAIFSQIKCSAAYMSGIAYEHYMNKKTVDVAYFEPFYLKAYQSVVSKVKGLQ